MDLKELMKQLVETDDKMERMSLVEKIMEMMDNPSMENPEMDTMKTENESMKGEMEKLRNKVEELNQKYIDRFFSGGESKEDNPSPMENEEKEEKTKTLDDILGKK